MKYSIPMKITNFIHCFVSFFIQGCTNNSSTFGALPLTTSVHLRAASFWCIKQYEYIQDQYINAKIKTEIKFHTVAMMRFPGDTATPKHESNASLEGCKEKCIFDLVGKTKD